MRSGADCVPGRMLIIGRRNMNIEYRRAAAADAETLVSIYNAAFYSDSVKYGECPGYGKSAEEMARSIERYPKYLISCDGRPAGCVSCKNLAGGTYEIGCLCVVPEFQRRGIGAAAMGFIQAAHPDWETITLVTPADKGGNLQFYIRKCGFQLEKVEMDGGVQVARLTLKRAHPAQKTRD